jgi:hypothetical protein
MGYNQALEKAWSEIAHSTDEPRFSIKLLADEYEIDVPGKHILSLSCNAPAKEYVSIILLHYLMQKIKLKALPLPTEEWIDFRQLEGGQGYFPTFKKRVIDVILRKYGAHPQALLDAGRRLPIKKAQISDMGIVLQVFPEVPILITLWRADEEFSPDAKMLFDKSILKIFCTEDIVVLAEFIAHAL